MDEVLTLQRQKNRQVGDKQYYRWTINIPPALVAALDWRESQSILFYAHNNQLMLYPMNNTLRKPIEEVPIIRNYANISDDELMHLYGDLSNAVTNVYFEMRRRGVLSSKEESVRPPVRGGTPISEENENALRQGADLSVTSMKAIDEIWKRLEARTTSTVDIRTDRIPHSHPSP